MQSIREAKQKATRLAFIRTFSLYLTFLYFRQTKEYVHRPYNAEVAAWRLARPSTHLVPTLLRRRNYVTVAIRTVSGRRRNLTNHKMGLPLTRCNESFDVKD